MVIITNKGVGMKDRIIYKDSNIRIRVMELKNTILEVYDKRKLISTAYINLPEKLTKITNFKKIEEEFLFYKNYDLILQMNPFYGYLLAEEYIIKNSKKRITDYLLFRYSVEIKHKLLKNNSSTI